MKSIVPENVDIFYSCEIPVRWGDMDAFGHVNNSIYFRYFEEARSQLLYAKNIPIDGGNHPVLVSIGCTFLTPVFYPDHLRIDMYISEAGRSSFMMHYRVFTRTNPEAPVAEAYSKIVWISHHTGKSIPLPDVVRQWFTTD